MVGFRVSVHSKSTVLETVTSAVIEVSQSEVEEAILEIEEALKEVRALDGEDSSLEDLTDIDLDEKDSCDDMSPGRYSRLESERKVDPRPVLCMVNRVKETL